MTGIWQLGDDCSDRARRTKLDLWVQHLAKTLAGQCQGTDNQKRSCYVVTLLQQRLCAEHLSARTGLDRRKTLWGSWAVHSHAEPGLRFWFAGKLL